MHEIESNNTYTGRSFPMAAPVLEVEAEKARRVIISLKANLGIDESSLLVACADTIALLIALHERQWGDHKLADWLDVVNNRIAKSYQLVKDRTDHMTGPVEGGGK